MAAARVLLALAEAELRSLAMMGQAWASLGLAALLSFGLVGCKDDEPACVPGRVVTCPCGG
jgi:hypothetical protein